MDLREVRSQLDLDYDYETLPVDWAVSQENAPRGRAPFLNHDEILRAYRDARVPEAAHAAFTKAAARVRETPCLAALLWHCHYQLFVKGSNAPATRIAPDPKAALGDLSGMFRALVMLSGVPNMLRRHAERKIPETITAHTLEDLALWMEEYHRTHNGVWGLAQLGWLTNHLTGRLYRVGRLQFIARKFSVPLEVFRHRKTGRVCALSLAGIRYRADGQVDGTNDLYDPRGAWLSRLDRTQEAVTGNWVSPDSAAHREPVALPRADWEPALDAESTVLEIHMAAGSPLGYDECGASVSEGLDFFRRHFPEDEYAGLQCVSWLLDPQLQAVLPETSNIVRFMREFYLFPLVTDAGQACERAFDQYPLNLRDAPRETSLQRALLTHVESGGRFRCGGCFMLARDLDWGSRIYLARDSEPPPQRVGGGPEE